MPRAGARYADARALRAGVGADHGAILRDRGIHFTRYLAVIVRLSISTLLCA